MTARTPLETLTLARDYLDSLLADAPAVVNGWLVQNVEKCTCGTPSVAAHGHEPYCGYEPLTDDPLTVALHATAPAIRELLEAAEFNIRATRDGNTHATVARAVDVATALLSTPHAAQWITDREAK